MSPVQGTNTCQLFSVSVYIPLIVWNIVIKHRVEQIVNVTKGMAGPFILYS